MVGWGELGRIHSVPVREGSRPTSRGGVHEVDELGCRLWGRHGGARGRRTALVEGDVKTALKRRHHGDDKGTASGETSNGSRNVQHLPRIGAPHLEPRRYMVVPSPPMVNIRFPRNSHVSSQPLPPKPGSAPWPLDPCPGLGCLGLALAPSQRIRTPFLAARQICSMALEDTQNDRTGGNDLPFHHTGPTTAKDSPLASSCWNWLFWRYRDGLQRPTEMKSTTRDASRRRAPNHRHGPCSLPQTP